MAEIRLPSLLSDLPMEWTSIMDIPDVPVRSVQFDSREIKPGDLFVALPGGSSDGHRFILDAVTNGAVAAVGCAEIEPPAIPYIHVVNSREALAHLAAAIYGHPARRLRIIGVTGTDGKTTTTNLIYHILKEAGYACGMISTVNALIGDTVVDTGFHVTTPEAPDVQRYLASMVEAGLEIAVLETTSHGLAQHRVTACEFDIAVVTNITHEHLDYHGTYEDYRAAKGKLFVALESTVEKESGNPRIAILNEDDQAFDYLAELVKGDRITYGLNGKGDLTAKDIICTPEGVDFYAKGNGFDHTVHCNLPGRFNVSNCLAALSVSLVQGIPVDVAVRGISALTGVPGRMEAINMGQSFTAIVDFAHTPNALKRALETAKEMSKGKVIAIFGSAGLRDRQKRRLMAEVSLELADITILTAEDPRTESLDSILAQMADAAESAGGVEGRNFFRVTDRGEAIRMGCEMSNPGDLVIACGKGHEQSMCFGTTEYLWDDRIAMRSVLARLQGLVGPPMPYLPTQK